MTKAPLPGGLHPSRISWSSTLRAAIGMRMSFPSPEGEGEWSGGARGDPPASGGRSICARRRLRREPTKARNVANCPRDPLRYGASRWDHVI